MFGCASSIKWVVAVLAGFGCIANAQWVDFTDETPTRLLLSSVSTNDAQEKDITTADIDRDGDTDVIIVRKRPFSTPGGNDDVLLMNEGGVLVDRTVQYGFDAGTSDARDVICVDVDGDQWLDIVICTTFEDPIRLYMNLGNDGGGNWLGMVDESGSRLGTVFEDSRKYCAVGAGDVNGDNSPDLFFSNYNGGDDLLYINDGNGNFTDQTQSRMGQNANSAFGTSNAIVDIDGDGDGDIIKLTTLYNEPPFDRGIFVLWNNGSGVFDAIPFQRVSNPNEPYMFILEDFDGNGSLDMYVVNDGADQLYLTTSVVPNSQWNMTISNPSPSPRTGGFGGNLRATDIDNDGDIDLGVGPIDTDIQNCGESNGFAFLRNNGGSLGDPIPNNNPQNYNIEPHDFAFFDINGDGCDDVFMGLCTGYRVFIQSNCVSVCLPDFNDDGQLDFFDISTFLTAFRNQHPEADFTGDGQFDFFDIAAFLSAFAAGCP